MEDFGTALVFPLEIVAIEKGAWSDAEQDWLAILVANGGARIATSVYMKRAAKKLEVARIMAAPV